MKFVTITGLKHYYGTTPFKVGRILRLTKDFGNEYDDCAICAELPYIGTVGYVANAENTVYDGTYCAGVLYDVIGVTAYCEVAFVTHSSAIARVLSDEELTELRTAHPERIPDFGEGRKEERRFKFVI